METTSNKIKEYFEAESAVVDVPSWPAYRTISDGLETKGIMSARVRRVLDKNGLNQDVASRASDLKAKYVPKVPKEAAKGTKDAAPSADDASKPAESKPKIVMSEPDRMIADALSDARIRVGNKAPGYLRLVCEEIVNDLSRASIESTLKHGRKIVLADKMFDGNGAYINKCRFRNLFVNLPTFVALRAKYESNRCKLAAATVASKYMTSMYRNVNKNSHARVKTIREEISAFVDAIDETDSGATKPVASTSAAAAEPKAEENSSSNFEFYIARMIKNIKHNNQAYADLRVSADLIKFIDSILVEFIKLVAIRSLIMIGMIGAITVSADTIRTVILSMFVNHDGLNDRHVETFETIKSEGEPDRLEAIMSPISLIMQFDAAIPRPAKEAAKEDVVAESSSKPDGENVAAAPTKEGASAPVVEAAKPVEVTAKPAGTVAPAAGTTVPVAGTPATAATKDLPPPLTVPKKPRAPAKK